MFASQHILASWKRVDTSELNIFFHMLRGVGYLSVLTIVLLKCVVHFNVLYLFFISILYILLIIVIYKVYFTEF